MMDVNSEQLQHMRYEKNPIDYIKIATISSFLEKRQHIGLFQLHCYPP